MKSFVYELLPGRVVFGVGSTRDIAREVDRLGATRVVVVSDSSEARVAEGIAEVLDRRLVGRWSEIRAHVPVELAERARSFCAELEADLLLAVGGGSTIGLAKAVALSADVRILAVPTTYSGSEMTPIYGLTEGARKTTGRSLRALPAVVVYDPQLSVTLPPAISGPSGMNAMAHCVEALYAPGANPVTSMLAVEAVRALASGLARVVRQPDDLEARSETLYGAYLAGSVLASAGTSIHHKVCHVLGGRYDLPHAKLHTVVLPQAAHLVATDDPAVLQPVAGALGVDYAPAGLYDLAVTLGAPTSLDQLGLSEPQLMATAREIAAAGVTATREFTETDVRALLAAALTGRRPAPQIDRHEHLASSA